MLKSGKQHFYRNLQKTSIQKSLASTISHGYPKLQGKNEKNVCRMINIYSNCPERPNFEQEAVTSWGCLCRKHGKIMSASFPLSQNRIGAYLTEWMKLRQNVGTILFLVPRTQ